MQRMSILCFAGAAKFTGHAKREREPPKYSARRRFCGASAQTVLVATCGASDDNVKWETKRKKTM